MGFGGERSEDGLEEVACGKWRARDYDRGGEQVVGCGEGVAGAGL